MDRAELAGDHRAAAGPARLLEGLSDLVGAAVTVRGMARPRRSSARGYGTAGSGWDRCSPTVSGRGELSPAQPRCCRAPRRPPHARHRCRAAHVRGFSPVAGGDELPQHPLRCARPHAGHRDPAGLGLSDAIRGCPAGASRVWTVGWPFWARHRLRGVRLLATDTDWFAGAGVELRGPIGCFCCC